jgi:drug/metabolite transporter (DMT)-like permease
VAFLWWGEYFSPAGYMGSALILAAVIFMVREPAERDRPDSVDAP